MSCHLLQFGAMLCLLTSSVSHNQFIDAIADDCFVIADESSKDYRLTDKGLAFDAEHVQRSKLRIETRLKLLAKWDPKRYGERQQVEHSGSIDSATTILAARRQRSGRG